MRQRPGGMACCQVLLPPLCLSSPLLRLYLVSSTPSESKLGFGPWHGGQDSRSAPAVFHHCDGLLQDKGSGLLHPDSGHGVRWVSIEHVVAVRRRRGHGLHSLQRDDPSKVYSSSIAVPNRLGPLPAHRSFRARIAASRTANPLRRSPASWDASRGNHHCSDVQMHGHFLPAIANTCRCACSFLKANAHGAVCGGSLGPYLWTRGCPRP